MKKFADWSIRYKLLSLLLLLGLPWRSLSVGSLVVGGRAPGKPAT